MSDDVKIGLDIDDNGSASRVEDDLINIKETFAEINKEASQFLKLLKETSNASEKAEKLEVLEALEQPQKLPK